MDILDAVYGINLARADTLRRIFGKKNADQLKTAHEECLAQAMDRGMDSTTEKTIFDYLVQSSGYAFNKSHAVAYSKISWQSAYLKANYPKEFGIVNSLYIDSSAEPGWSTSII